MAVYVGKKCRHLKMQVALWLLCTVLGVDPSGRVLARWFERQMRRLQFSEDNQRWRYALNGDSYCKAHLSWIASRVPAVQNLVDHPIWRVLELNVVGRGVDILLAKHFPDFLCVGFEEMKQRLARCSDLDRLTVCLLLTVRKPSWSLNHPDVIADAACRLCAQNIWYPARYALVSLIHCWVEHINGRHGIHHWFKSNEELNFRVACWQDLHDWSWETPLVRNELHWQAFSYVFEQADRSRQQQILQSLRQRDVAGGSVFDDAVLHSVYRCRSGVVRRWLIRDVDVNQA